MKKFLFKFLMLDALKNSITSDHRRIEFLENRLDVLEREFNSREPCKICGKHRYHGHKAA